jgi:glycosyltransferase involved in cell wall biosynthesis
MRTGGVTLATAGRFHAYFLAKEFARMGCLDRLVVSDRRFLPPENLEWSAYVNRFDLAIWRHVNRFINLGYSEPTKSRIYEEWLARYLADKSPGVLHVWSGVALSSLKRLKGAGWLRCVERSCPHNLVQHELLKEEADLLGLPFTESRELVDRAVEELYLSDRVIVPSAYSASSYKDPELASKVRVNTLGGNYTMKPRQAESRKLIVLLVGNDFLRKGTHYLIEAFKLIDDPEAELWIRGHVPLAYRATIRDTRVKIIGDLLPKQLERLYEAASVFVQSSIDEGFGMTVLEALAYGLPLVVTNNVGCRDLLSPAVSITTPIRNPEALARAILAARHLPGEEFDRERRRILEANSWRACAERMLDEVYCLPKDMPRSRVRAAFPLC